MALDKQQPIYQTFEIGEQPEYSEKRVLVSKYEDVIRKVITDSKIGSIESGEIDGVQWKQVYRFGKQQPVSIVSFSFPEGATFELVFRPTFHGFESIYKENPPVRKYFPHLYFSQKTPVFQNVLVLDRINGYEEKHNGAEFISYVSTPENFDRLCAEVFEMVDEIYREPLSLTDIAPTDGHNVFYNTDTQRFQFFDVDTITASDFSHERKFMEFLNPGQKVSGKKITYLMKMIQMYKTKYPSFSLSYETEETTLHQCILVSETSKEEGLIRQSDPHYELTYRRIHWLGTCGQKNLPPIKVLQRKGKHKFSIRPDLIKASIENNEQEVTRILELCGGSIIENEFIETGKQDPIGAIQGATRNSLK